MEYKSIEATISSDLDRPGAVAIQGPDSHCQVEELSDDDAEEGEEVAPIVVQGMPVFPMAVCHRRTQPERTHKRPEARVRLPLRKSSSTPRAWVRVPPEATIGCTLYLYQDETLLGSYKCRRRFTLLGWMMVQVPSASEEGLELTVKPLSKISKHYVTVPIPPQLYHLSDGSLIHVVSANRQVFERSLVRQDASRLATVCLPLSARGPCCLMQEIPEATPISNPNEDNVVHQITIPPHCVPGQQFIVRPGVTYTCPPDKTPGDVCFVTFYPKARVAMPPIPLGQSFPCHYPGYGLVWATCAKDAAEYCDFYCVPTSVGYELVTELPLDCTTYGR